MWVSDRLQSMANRIYRGRIKLAGFLAGAVASLYLGALASVVITGTPIDLDEPRPAQVYTNF